MAALKTANWKGLFGRFGKSRDGMAALEFALVGPPFIFLLGVIFEASIMLFTDRALENGVSQAARMIRTGQVQKQGVTQEQFKALICDGMAGYIDCETKVRIEVKKFASFEDIDPEDLPNPTELEDDDEQFDPGGPMEVVLVRVRYDWKLFMPGISLLANMPDQATRRLSSGAAFRNEPYSG